MTSDASGPRKLRGGVRVYRVIVAALTGTVLTPEPFWLK